MASLKVLRRLVGVISNLAMLIGSNGDELAQLCEVLTEDITRTMDNIGLAVLNDRKAVAAEEAARAEAAIRETAIQHRKAQFFASVGTFLDRANHPDSAAAIPRPVSLLSTSPSAASWWTA
jgi:hypothetical protein